jgi:hypothetical protein
VEHADETRRRLSALDADLDPDEPPGYNDCAIFDIHTRPVFPGLLIRRRLDRELGQVAFAMRGNLTRVRIHTVYTPR